MNEFIIGLFIGFFAGRLFQFQIDKSAFEALKSKAVNGLDAIERKLKGYR